MSDTTSELGRSLRRQLEATADRVHDASGAWSETAERTLFESLVDDGWTRAALAESLGGAGGEPADAAAIAGAVAGTGHALPLADVMFTTARALMLAELALPADVRCAIALPSAGVVTASGAVQVRATRVPWARWASHFVVLAPHGSGTQVSLVASEHAKVLPGQNLALEPRDTVTIESGAVLASVQNARDSASCIAQLQRAAALARSVQIAGAIESIVTLCSRYCADRKQFGRALREFQAVQQTLALLAGESAAANAAVAQALAQLPPGSADWPLAPIATAKIRTGLAATAASTYGHQLHGAIGITLEYALHRYTRALWSWRDEAGSETEWSRQLLSAVHTAHAASVWEWLAPVNATPETKEF